MARKKATARVVASVETVDVSTEPVEVAMNLYWSPSTGEALVLFPPAVIEEGTPPGIVARAQREPVWGSTQLYFASPDVDRNTNPVALGPATPETVARVAAMVAERAPADVSVSFDDTVIYLEREGYKAGTMSGSLLARFLVHSMTYDHPRRAIELHPDPMLGDQIAAALASMDREETEGK